MLPNATDVTVAMRGLCMMPFGRHTCVVPSNTVLDRGGAEVQEVGPCPSIFQRRGHCPSNF